MHECGDDVGAEALSVADDGVLCLLREVVYEEHAEIYRAQLFEE